MVCVPVFSYSAPVYVTSYASKLTCSCHPCTRRSTGTVVWEELNQFDCVGWDS